MEKKHFTMKKKGVPPFHVVLVWCLGWQSCQFLMQHFKALHSGLNGLANFDGQNPAPKIVS